MDLQGLLNSIYDSANNALRISGDSGRELGYAQITSNLTSTSSTLADATGLTTTVTTGARPVVVEFHLPNWTNSATNFGIALAILEDGVSIWSTTAQEYTANATNGAMNARVRRNPAAGSHTYKVQLASYLSSGTQTVTIVAAATAPAFITVVER